MSSDNTNSPTVSSSNTNPDEEGPAISAAEAEEVLEDNTKSLLRHMISQLRYGMDLTKIAIPCQFVEPRSLLERLTDFISHPDLFCSVSAATTPIERILAVTRWYLSGWHIRPKGVKKPFNPILGEVFKCSFPMPDGSQLSYLAEQVSHHPPISAFHITNMNHNIIADGCYCPKSKFYGNSAASIADGAMYINVLNHREVYSCTWPNAYARGIIFGNLLMELGGKTAINCDQTGLHTEIEFKTKGFFTGEYNQVVAKIKTKGLKSKTLFTITGKWNEGYQIKNMETGEVKDFFSLKTHQPTNKTVPPLEEMNDNESVKLWKVCSEYIIKRDIERANQEKNRLEDKQRREKKERDDKKEKWIPVHFEEPSKQHFVFKETKHLLLK